MQNFENQKTNIDWSSQIYKLLLQHSIYTFLFISFCFSFPSSFSIFPTTSFSFDFASLLPPKKWKTEKRKWLYNYIEHLVVVAGATIIQNHQRSEWRCCRILAAGEVQSVSPPVNNFTHYIVSNLGEKMDTKYVSQQCSTVSSVKFHHHWPINVIYAKGTQS